MAHPPAWLLPGVRCGDGWFRGEYTGRSSSVGGSGGGSKKGVSAYPCEGVTIWRPPSPPRWVTESLGPLLPVGWENRNGGQQQLLCRGQLAEGEEGDEGGQQGSTSTSTTHH